MEMKPFRTRITCYCGGTMSKGKPQVCEKCGWVYDPDIKGSFSFDDHKRHIDQINEVKTLVAAASHERTSPISNS